MNQQSIITVNASRCGAGKTTQDIYPRIRRLIRNGQRVIAVVPSVKLAIDYQKAIDDSVMIISDGGEGVDKRLISAIAHRENCIVITQAAFLQHIWSYLDRGDYNLILDEVFDPFQFTNYKVDKITEIKTQFQIEPIMVMGNWFPVTSPPWRDHAAYRESESYRKLTNNNWWAWQSKMDNEKLHAGEWAQFGLELRKEAIMDGWPTIHIAAAKFEDTFLAAWMHKEGLIWQETEKFEPHENADIVWHTFDFKWSTTKRNDNPELHEQYRDYVNGHANGDRVISLRNADAKKIVLNNEVEVSHNCHGLNDYRDITRVSIESSLNMHPEQQKWLEEILEMTPAQIKRARTTYTHYQVIMRCALRVSGSLIDPIHVYSCDETVTFQLTDYFDRNKDVVVIPNTRPKRKLPLTNAEKMRVSRFRRANPEQNHMTNEEILNMPTRTRGRPLLSQENDLDD
jgi:hypothetical protein